MQTLRPTHLVQRPSSPSTMAVAVAYEPMAPTMYHHSSLPRGAQQPQIRPRSDLPFDAPKRKNVLRKTSKSSSSTTVTTIASSASSSNHNSNITSFHICTDSHSSPPIEPGCDPLLDRLRYDLNFPPQQKPLPPPPVVGPEEQCGRDNNMHDTHEIQASWSDSGHLMRQNTFSALFISPSSSSSSSETGHYDSVYHHPRSHAHHPHVHHPPPMPLAYHLPSRRLQAARPKLTVQLSSDLDSSVSHSHSIDSNLSRKSSQSWWKRPLGLLSDKRNKQDPQHHLSRATSLSVSTEPRPQARRIRDENGVISLSSATSESGHAFVSPTNDMVDFPSRAQRKLKKRPPSAWNPIKAKSPTAIPFHPVQPSAAPRSTPVNQHHYSNSAKSLPVHSSSSRFDRSRQPDIIRYRHTVYDDIGSRGHEYDYMTRETPSHVNSNSQYQHHPTFAANGHLLLNAEPLRYTPVSTNNTPVGFPSQDDYRFDALPPLPSVSPLRIHIPPSPTPPPNLALSETARWKSEPDLTTKTSVSQSRGLTSTSTAYFTSGGTGTRSEALLQSPIISSPSAYSPSAEEQTLPQVSSPPVSSETRPSFLRSPSNRRWTLAVSETPENELVEELERLRRIGWALGFQGELVKVRGEEEVIGADLDDTEVVAETNENTSSGGRQVSSSNSSGIPSDVKWRKEEMEQWLIARKALLVCREIVRTEKTYREGLETLQRGGTLNTPPPLLLQYLPALISASRAFSARLAEDPSAWGVSIAFINCEEFLEAALVAWSGVVGEFFGSGSSSNSRRDKKHETRRLGLATPPTKGRTTRRISLGFERVPLVQNLTAENSKTTETETEKKSSQTASARLSRNATTSFSNLQTALWRRSTPSFAFLLGHGDTGSNTKSFGALSSQDMAASISQKPRHFSLKFGSSGENVDSPHGSSRSKSGVKIPTVQDLAIQPVQRVVRYVLLYKDLFNSTPEASPSRALVERALEGATRLAQRCNRAQDNAAFLL